MYDFPLTTEGYQESTLFKLSPSLLWLAGYGAWDRKACLERARESSGS